MYAFAEAQASFDRALELWDLVPDADSRAPIDRVDVLVRATLAAQGSATHRSVAYLKMALALVDPVRDPTRAGLLYQLLGHELGDIGENSGSLAAYEEAVRLVPAEPPSAMRARVFAGLGTWFFFNDRHLEAIALLEEAVAVAAAAGTEELRALAPLGAARVVLGDVDRGLSTIRRASEIAEARDDVYESARARAWLSGGLYEAGRDEHAVTAASEAADYAIRHGLGARWGSIALAMAADAMIELGRWDDAATALASAPRIRPGRLRTGHRRWSRRIPRCAARSAA